MPRSLPRAIPWRRESILDVYNVAIGAILFASPWLFSYAHGAAAFDAWGSGALVVLLSIAAIVAFSEWEEWVTLLAGLWLIVSPWLLGFPHTTAMHIAIGAGVLITYMAVLEICILHYGPPGPPPPHSTR